MTSCRGLHGSRSEQGARDVSRGGRQSRWGWTMSLNVLCRFYVGGWVDGWI